MHCQSNAPLRSKGTHGQTRGLSRDVTCWRTYNYWSIILKAVKTSWVHTMCSLAGLRFQYGDGLGLRG